MRVFLATLACILLIHACARAQTPSPCRPVMHLNQSYTVCSFDAGEPARLWLTHPDGAPFGQFDRLAEHTSNQGHILIFAMNAGMYHDDRRPVGLYIENGEQAAPIVTRAGPGNFGMLPNGVFWIDSSGVAHVTESLAFEVQAPDARFATQSGPMLVIEGALHPDFNEDGPSRKRRNGVGVARDGTLHFAISDVPVNFHSFATLFRDELDTPNALFLDGYVSKLYAPGIGRNEAGLDMGPIVGVTRPSDTD
jgi:uncharacterized protein YigE (DUF2233 family)